MKSKTLIFLYDDATQKFLCSYNGILDWKKEWQQARDFSDFNFIQRFFLRKLLSKLVGTELRYKKILNYYDSIKGLC